MRPQRYFLRDQAWICLSGNYYVVLDLARDKYLCIAKANLDVLRPWLSLPSSLADAQERPLFASTVALPTFLTELIDCGLITAEPSANNSIAPEAPEMELAGLIAAPARSEGLVQCLLHLPAFLASTRSARRSLQYGSMAQTIERIREKKHHGCIARSAFLFEELRQLVGIFCRLRPFYNRKYLCLFDSLALLNFLASYSIYPNWVFAVQSEPFAAHCWVQADGVLLNETLERARLYTPVLSV